MIMRDDEREVGDVAGRLDGTTALVTGASSGIGEATARALAAEGAAVAVVARREDRLHGLVEKITGDGGRALAIPADVTAQAAAADAVERTVGEFGRLDTVINNAGVMLLGPVVDAPLEEWDRMVALNVQGLLYTAHAALPHLLRAASDGPRQVADLVNVSSVAGRVAREGSGVYNLTKHGVGAFSESLRQEVTRRHVRVSLVEPGAVVTELTSPPARGGPRAGVPPVRRHGTSGGRRHRGRDHLHRHPTAPDGRQRGAHPPHRAGGLRKPRECHGDGAREHVPAMTDPRRGHTARVPAGGATAPNLSGSTASACSAPSCSSPRRR